MTEKNYNPKQKERKAMEKAELAADIKSIEQKPEFKEKSKKEMEQKVDESKEDVKEPKKETKENPKIKKTEAVVNGVSVPVSTVYSIEVCRFIKNKPINTAIYDLEQVLVHKKAIPMRGEYAHKKSVKGISSGVGKYPEQTAGAFIKLLKSLSANAAANGVENPIIFEAFANIAPRPRGRFGRWKRKRTHIRIAAKERKMKEKKK